MIDPRPLPQRRQYAERHRDQHGEQQAEERKLGRCRQPVRDLAQHRLTRCERHAEIAVREIGHVAPELHDQRLIEAELMLDDGDRLLGRDRPGEVCGWVAGQNAGQQKGDDDDADQARYGRPEPRYDQATHG